MTTNNEAVLLLTKLADKFGTTVDHLWGVLVKQAAVTATINTTLAIALCIFSFFLFRLVRRKTRTPNATKENPYPRAEWDEDSHPPAWIGIVILLTLTCFAVCEAVSTASTAILNPEYWALKQLLK